MTPLTVANMEILKKVVLPTKIIRTIVSVNVAKMSSHLRKSNVFVIMHRANASIRSMAARISDGLSGPAINQMAIPLFQPTANPRKSGVNGLTGQLVRLLAAPVIEVVQEEGA